jgi:hypothetical protein
MATPEPNPDPLANEPWLSEFSQQQADAFGLSLSAYVERQFGEARDRVRGELQALRLRVRDEQTELRNLDARGASDDAISTMAGNIERLLARIKALTEDYEVLLARRKAALRTLARNELSVEELNAEDLNPDEVIAEAERLLRRKP